MPSSQENNSKTLLQTSLELIENPIFSLVEVMRSVKTDTPEAELNVTTISDGKGGRILL